MIKVTVESAKFGLPSYKGGNRLDNLRAAQSLGASIDPEFGGCEDVNGNVHFLVPENQVEAFHRLVNSFSAHSN